MRYEVYCKRNHLAVGWITFEAETPEQAAELARARGWEVEHVKRAREGRPKSPQRSTPPARAGLFVMGAAVGCLVAIVLGVLAVVAAVLLTRPEITERLALRQRAVVQVSQPISRCGQPIRWYVGDVDPRFNVTREEVRIAAERAAAIWQEAWGEQILFVHDENGDMPITLEYDQRLYELNRQYSEYERAMHRYNRNVALYNQQLEMHQMKVQAWRPGRGREGEAERARLDVEGERLHRMRDRLGEDERNLERLRPRGVLGGSTYGDYREHSHRDADTGRLMEITDRLVTIYYFDDLDHFAFILAHEFGHALLGDKDHLDDPTALMHATPEFPEDQQIRLSYADRMALWTVCTEQ